MLTALPRRVKAGEVAIRPFKSITIAICFHMVPYVFSHRSWRLSVHEGALLDVRSLIFRVAICIALRRALVLIQTHCWTSEQGEDQVPLDWTPISSTKSIRRTYCEEQTVYSILNMKPISRICMNILSCNIRLSSVSHTGLKSSFSQLGEITEKGVKLVCGLSN